MVSNDSAASSPIERHTSYGVGGAGNLRSSTLPISTLKVAAKLLTGRQSETQQMQEILGAMKAQEQAQEDQNARRSSTTSIMVETLKSKVLRRGSKAEGSEQ